MKFKSIRVAGEWDSPSLFPILKQIVSGAEAYALAKYDWDFLVTCIYRSPDENEALTGNRDGVHVNWRGVDVRTFGIEDDAVLDVAAWTNEHWQYDETRPMMKVCIGESEGPQSSGRHLHFQMHPRTVALTTPSDGSTVETT